jgi:hypothetical protein
MDYRAIAMAMILVGSQSAAQTTIPEATELMQSRRCTASVGWVFSGAATPPPSTMSMNNDDGWCWLDATATQGSLVIAPTIRVTRQPAHGQIVVSPTPVKNKTRIAYKPAPTFTGKDSFTVLNVNTNNERQVEVTVTPTQ